jgi:hypothetical protein
LRASAEQLELIKTWAAEQVLNYTLTDKVRAETVTKALLTIKIIHSLHILSVLKVWSQIEGGYESIP